MIFVGIDPGQKGAFSLVDHKARLVEYWIMGELYDMRMKLIPYQDKIKVVAIERAQAMAKQGRKQGASGMFAYGKGYGKLLGMLETLNMPYEEIRPLQWMQKMYVKWEAGTSKEKGREICKAMHPDVTFMPTKRYKYMHDGLTDATMIAHYARRYLQ
jgi:hypothetical protein